MKDRYSVFEYCGYRPRYYLRHPIKWVRDKWRELKWAKQRAIRGYADCDVWNMDTWFSYVVANMLDQLRDTANSWPDNENFKTFEDWQAWLHKIAAAIRMMREEEQDKINSYWPPYKDELDNWQIWGHKGPTQAFKNYNDEAQKIAAEAQKNFEAAMIELSRYFSTLWD